MNRAIPITHPLNVSLKPFAGHNVSETSWNCMELNLERIGKCIHHGRRKDHISHSLGSNKESSSTLASSDRPIESRVPVFQFPADDPRQRERWWSSPWNTGLDTRGFTILSGPGPWHERPRPYGSIRRSLRRDVPSGGVRDASGFHPGDPRHRKTRLKIEFSGHRMTIWPSEFKEPLEEREVNLGSERDGAEERVVGATRWRQGGQKRR